MASCRGFFPTLKAGSSTFSLLFPLLSCRFIGRSSLKDQGRRYPALSNLVAREQILELNCCHISNPSPLLAVGVCCAQQPSKFR
jgi:hypothetical protein